VEEVERRRVAAARPEVRVAAARDARTAGAAVRLHHRDRALALTGLGPVPLLEGGLVPRIGLEDEDGVERGEATTRGDARKRGVDEPLAIDPHHDRLTEPRLLEKRVARVARALADVDVLEVVARRDHVVDRADVSERCDSR